MEKSARVTFSLIVSALYAFLHVKPLSYARFFQTDCWKLQNLLRLRMAWRTRILEMFAQIFSQRMKNKAAENSKFLSRVSSITNSSPAFYSKR